MITDKMTIYVLWPRGSSLHSQVSFKSDKVINYAVLYLIGMIEGDLAANSSYMSLSQHADYKNGLQKLLKDLSASPTPLELPAIDGIKKLQAIIEKYENLMKPFERNAFIHSIQEIELVKVY
jgi:hypothetical protein